MQAKKHENSVFHITLNLTLAGLIAGVVIAAVYSLAWPRILENRTMLKEEAMRRLLPKATSFVKIANDGTYTDRYEARSAAGLEGYIIPAEERGYGGAIHIIAAVGTDGRLTGFEIVSHNETPGLGDRATSPAFRNQFTGHRHGENEITKTGEEGKIDALSGATITSRAVAKAVDAALAGLPAQEPDAALDGAPQQAADIAKTGGVTGDKTALPSPESATPEAAK